MASTLAPLDNRVTRALPSSPLTALRLTLRVLSRTASALDWYRSGIRPSWAGVCGGSGPCALGRIGLTKLNQLHLELLHGEVDGVQIVPQKTLLCSCKVKVKTKTVKRLPTAIQEEVVVVTPAIQWPL